jgi:hypothetical protein
MEKRGALKYAPLPIRRDTMNTKYRVVEPPRTIEIAASRKVTVGKTLVVAASITALAANVTAVLYDGVDASGVVVQRLSVVPNMTVGGSFPDGVLFEHGLFVALAGANVSLTLSYFTGLEEHNAVNENGSD